MIVVLVTYARSLWLNRAQELRKNLFSGSHAWQRDICACHGHVPLPHPPPEASSHFDIDLKLTYLFL